MQLVKELATYRGFLSCLRHLLNLAVDRVEHLHFGVVSFVNLLVDGEILSTHLALRVSVVELESWPLEAPQVQFLEARLKTLEPLVVGSGIGIEEQVFLALLSHL